MVRGRRLLVERWRLGRRAAAVVVVGAVFKSLRVMRLLLQVIGLHLEGKLVEGESRPPPPRPRAPAPTPTLVVTTRTAASAAAIAAAAAAARTVSFVAAAGGGGSAKRAKARGGGCSCVVASFAAALRARHDRL